MANEQIPEESNVQAFFERTVSGAIKFCGQSVYMFRFLLSPPSSLQKRIQARDTRLAPPLSFLTVGVFVAGMVQRLSYAIDPAESYSGEAFTAEFHNAYSQISLWEVSLRTFPGVILVVSIGVLVARCAKSQERFDRDPIVATACYAAGLHSLIFGLLYFTIMWVNAFYSDEVGAVVGQSLKERLLTGAFALTGLYGALAIAMSIRSSTKRNWIASPFAHFPIGIATTILLLAITYITVEVSFDIDSANSRGHARFEQEHKNGFRISIVQSHSEPGPNNQLSQLNATLALTNVSNQKILVPRHRSLVTADKKTSLRMVGNSIDMCEDKALVIEPNQTRVVQWQVDMSALRMELVRGEISERIMVPIHKSKNGYSFQPQTHYINLPLPTYGTAVRRGIGVRHGIGLVPGTLIGRPPESGFGIRIE